MLLSEKLANAIFKVFSAFPFILDHGPAFCAGLLLGVVIGTIIPLWVFACFKMDKQLEERAKDERGDKQ